MKELLKISILYLLTLNSVYADKSDEINSLLNEHGDNIIKSIGPLLKELSNSWSIDVLENAISQTYFDDSKEKYKKMLLRASVLGKYQGCNSLVSGSKKDIEDIKNMFFMFGQCQYKNGNAEVAILLLIEKNKVNIIQVLIGPSKK